MSQQEKPAVRRKQVLARNAALLVLVIALWFRPHSWLDWAGFAAFAGFAVPTLMFMAIAVASLWRGEPVTVSADVAPAPRLVGAMPEEATFRGPEGEVSMEDFLAAQP